MGARFLLHAVLVFTVSSDHSHADTLIGSGVAMLSVIQDMVALRKDPGALGARPAASDIRHTTHCGFNTSRLGASLPRRSVVARTQLEYKHPREGAHRTTATPAIPTINSTRLTAFDWLFNWSLDWLFDAAGHNDLDAHGSHDAHGSLDWLLDATGPTRTRPTLTRPTPTRPTLPTLGTLAS